ncbi:GWxTD domain-containing protein [Flavobacteriales bacterium]|nr:GWxTD domain-containing protein [Flavobacteriales bacterium]
MSILSAMKQTNFFSYKVFAGLILSLVVFGCSTNKLSTNEESYTYDSKIKSLNPKYVVYHQNDSVSYVYFEIQTKELLYVRENSTKPFEAKVQFHYELYSDFKANNLKDSATKILYDYKDEEGDRQILARVPIKIKLGEIGVLQLITRDVNKKVRDKSIITIDKKNVLSPQFFLIKEKESGSICFDNRVTVTNDLIVESHYNKNETFVMEYFNTNYPASKPPFSSNKLVEVPAYRDSSFLVSLTDTAGEFSLPKQGSYFMKALDSISYHLIFERLDTNFDAFRNHLGIIEPLKYICTSTEYNELVSSADKRKAVETFWLKIAGNKERAKVVIAEYYRRVELANRYFTTYKEGWKTDRGMLSIVMGLPKTIYKTRNGETWIYGTPHNMMMSLTFNFTKENEETFENDYQLTRYRTYREYWYRACESWRRGRIYTFN